MSLGRGFIIYGREDVPIENGGMRVSQLAAQLAARGYVTCSH